MSCTQQARSRRRRKLSPLLLLSVFLAAAVFALPADASVPRAGAEAVDSGPLLAANLETPFALLVGDEFAKALTCNPTPSPDALTPTEVPPREPPQPASRACEGSFSLHLEPVNSALNPQRGPPLEIPDLHQGWSVADPKTRIGGFRLNPEDFIGGERQLSLDPHWGYLVGRVGLTEDEPTDPWGLEASPTATPKQVGWLYEIEGVLDGEPVNYVGSTVSELRKRFSKHKWKELIQAKTTTVRRVPVYGELDVSASGRGTLRSAANEAVRGPEQRLMSQRKAEIEKANAELGPGQRPTRILNEVRAAEDPEAFVQRHKVTTGKTETVKAPGGGWLIPGLMGLQAVMDGYQRSMDLREARYRMAPYRLMDEGGEFTIAEQENCLLCANDFYKLYASGDREGQKVQITRKEARKLKEEAEALWGTLDWSREFVPGVLNRELPEKAEGPWH